MTDILETRLNDTIFSATSCEWHLNRAPVIGITAVDYEQKRERKLVHASRRDGTPLGFTSGKYSVGSFSITMLRSSWQRCIEILSLMGLGSYGDAIFPFRAVYTEPLAALKGVPPIVLAFEGCRILGEKDSTQEGIDELLTVVDLGALLLTRNGLRLWSVINSL